MAFQIMIFIGGLAILAVASEFLVSGASRLAALLGVSPLIIGLTVLAYGTSLPELVVSVLAAMKGSSPLALGNAVGSNLMNTGLILGLVAILAPVTTDVKLLRRDLPLYLIFCVIFGAILFNGFISRLEGLLMIAIMVAYLAYSTISEWPSKNKDKEAAPEIKMVGFQHGITFNILMILAGCIGLYFGAEMMVNSAIYIAKTIGISERIIGLTIVAIGTSLPELATTLSAARRKHNDLITGNLIGSNIFNLMLIVGAAGAVTPFTLQIREVFVEYSLLIVNALMVYVFLYTGRKISRGEGIVLTAFYAGFLGLLLLRGFF